MLTAPLLLLGLASVAAAAPVPQRAAEEGRSAGDQHAVDALAGLAAADNCTCTYTHTDMACAAAAPACELGIQVRCAPSLCHSGCRRCACSK